MTTDKGYDLNIHNNIRHLTIIFIVCLDNDYVMLLHFQFLFSVEFKVHVYKN